MASMMGSVIPYKFPSSFLFLFIFLAWMMRMYAVGTSILCFELDVMTFWWSIWVKKKLKCKVLAFLSFSRDQGVDKATLIGDDVLKWDALVIVRTIYCETMGWIWSLEWMDLWKRKAYFEEFCNFYMRNGRKWLIWGGEWIVLGWMILPIYGEWIDGGLVAFVVDFVRNWKPRTLGCQFEIH